MLLTVLMISLLASCAPARESAEEKRNALLESDFACEARLTCDLGDDVVSYTMEIHPGERTDLTLIEPEELKGLKASVEGEDLTLTYQDVLFACETPGDAVYPPVMLLPAAWAALKEGVLVESEMTEEGLLASFSRFEGEEEYIFTFLFGNEETPLKRITLEKNGRELASAVILRTLMT